MTGMQDTAGRHCSLSRWPDRTLCPMDQTKWRPLRRARKRMTMRPVKYFFKEYSANTTFHGFTYIFNAASCVGRWVNSNYMPSRFSQSYGVFFMLGGVGRRFSARNTALYKSNATLEFHKEIGLNFWIGTKRMIITPWISQKVRIFYKFISAISDQIFFIFKIFF